MVAILGFVYNIKGGKSLGEAYLEWIAVGKNHYTMEKWQYYFFHYN